MSDRLFILYEVKISQLPNFPVDKNDHPENFVEFYLAD